MSSKSFYKSQTLEEIFSIKDNAANTAHIQHAKNLHSDVRKFYSDVLHALKAKQFEIAIERLEDLKPKLQFLRKTFAYQSLMADCCKALDETKKYEFHLESAIRLAPSRLLAMLLEALAKASYSLGDFQKVIEISNQWSEHLNPNTLYVYGYALINVGNLNAAHEIFVQLEAKARNNGDIQETLAFIKALNDDYDSSLVHATNAEKMRVTLRSRELKIHAYLKLGRYREALNAFELPTELKFCTQKLVTFFVLTVSGLLSVELKSSELAYLRKRSFILSHQNFTQHFDMIINQKLKCLFPGERTLVEKIYNQERENSKNYVALINYGRSGSGLLHALLSSHSQITTVPTVGLMEFFNTPNLSKLQDKKKSGISSYLATKYEPLFNTSSDKAIETAGGETHNFQYKEGLTTLGPNSDQKHTVDIRKFKTEYQNDLQKTDEAGSVFEKFVTNYSNVMHKKTSNRTHLVYHIHNASDDAQLNFQKICPHYTKLLIVREPIGNVVSWVFKDLNKNSDMVYSKIIELLNFIWLPIFGGDQKVYYVQLEKLKRLPEPTVSELLKTFKLKYEHQCLTPTVGKHKWNGDPSSAVKELNDTSSLDQDISIFISDADRLRFDLLFDVHKRAFSYPTISAEMFKYCLHNRDRIFTDTFDFEVSLANTIGEEKYNTLQSYRAMFHQTKINLLEFYSRYGQIDANKFLNFSEIAHG